MKISQYDCVMLKDGREGTVIEIFEQEPTYMVEICDDEGIAIDTLIVSTSEIDRVTYHHITKN